MADTKQRITMEIGAKDDGATATLNKVGQGLDKLQNKAKSASGNQPGGMGGFFKNIKKQAEGSGIAGDTGLVGFLKGAGALEGIRLLGQGLQKIPEIATQYQADKRVGNASMSGTIAEGFATAIPVAGDLAKGFRAITDIPEMLRQEAIDFRRKQVDETDALRERAVARERAGQQVKDTALGNIRSAYGADTVASTPEALRGIQAANNAYAELDAQLNIIRRDAVLAKVPLDAIAQLDNSQKAQRDMAFKAIEREMKEVQRLRVERTRETENQILDVRAQASSEGLAIQGKDLQAALVLIERNAAKTEEAIRHAYDEAVRKGEQPSAKQRDALLYEQGRLTDAAKFRATDADRINKDQRTLDINKSGLDILRQQAELGQGITKAEVERLEIIEQAAERRREINELLRKENLSADQVASLKGQRDAINAIEEERIKQIGLGKFSGGTAATEQSRFLTGVANIARENDPTMKLVKLNEAQLKAQEAIKKGIEDLAKNLSGVATYKGAK